MTVMTKTSIRVFLIDDHKIFTDGLTMVINSQTPTMEVIGTASNRAEALTSVVTMKPDLILLDMDLGDSCSLDFLPDLLEKTPAKILMLTGLQNPDLHDEAIVKGARGIVLKGEPAKVILKAIEKVHAGEIWASNTMLARVIEHINSGNIVSDREAQKIADLTVREREIISSLMTNEGSTNEEIARQLFISPSTLKNHLTTIYSKLEVKNRIQLMKYALKHKLTKLIE